MTLTNIINSTQGSRDMMTVWMLRIAWISLATLDSLVLATPCYQTNGSCIPVNHTMCLTTKISFKNTSTIYTNGSLTLNEISLHLEAWSHLRRVPECWNIIQPFLCSVYLPKCNADAQEVEKPNRELCERVKGPCEIVTRFNGEWPWFLKCDQWFYAESCGVGTFKT